MSKTIKLLTVVDGDPQTVGRCYPGQAHLLQKQGIAEWKDGKLWLKEPSSHNVTVSLSLEVKVPRTVVIRVWDWWDYTSLGLLVAALVLVLARWFVLGRFRTELDKRGLTLEEYRTIAEELRNDRDAALKKIDAQVREKGLDPQRARKMKAEVRDGYAKSRASLRAGTWIKADGGV